VCEVPCGGTNLICHESNTCSGPLQECVNDSCECRNIGDDEVINIKDFTNYSCVGGVLTVRINKCAAKHFSYNLENLFIGGTTSDVTGRADYRCYGSIDLNHEGVEYIWTLDLTAIQDHCKTEIYFDGGNFIFKNSLQGIIDMPDSGTLVAVREEIFMSLTCSISAADIIKRYTHSDQPMNFATVIDEFDLNVYNTATYKQKISVSKIIPVPRYVYVNAIMTSAKPETRLVIQTCYFSEKEDRADTTSISYIFQNGCPTSSTNVFQNGVNYAASFGAKSVSFGSNVKEAYLHCYAEFCDSNLDSCEPSCGLRKRRETGGRSGVWKKAGPFKFTTVNQCRYNGQSVCGDNARCNELQDDTIECICRNGYEINPFDSYSCIVSEKSDTSSTDDVVFVGGGKLLESRRTAFGLSEK